MWHDRRWDKLRTEKSDPERYYDGRKEITNPKVVTRTQMQAGGRACSLKSHKFVMSVRMNVSLLGGLQN